MVGVCGGTEAKDRQSDAHLPLADQHQRRQRAEAACVDGGCGERDSQVLHGSEGVCREDDGAGGTGGDVVGRSGAVVPEDHRQHENAATHTHVDRSLVCSSPGVWTQAVHLLQRGGSPCDRQHPRSPHHLHHLQGLGSRNGGVDRL